MKMSESQPDFVEWREKHISQERGRRLVHYYLEDSSGQSYLAVVGTERSLRHMLYVVSDEFNQAYGSDDSGVSALKWRSRREVIDWLISFLPGKTSSRNYLRSPDMTFNGLKDTGTYPRKQLELGRSLSGRSSDIVWSGIPWICGKQLRHYQAYCRNGTSIATHSFVFVMSEEENRYLAYLEDMYEDKKEQKKVKVRWFHQNQEFACTIPPPTPHPCEVFITPYSQVISAECVDDVATVLTPDHYEKCLAALPYSSSAGTRLCFRQYSKNKFKHFDLRTLRGYFNQTVLSCLEICSVSGDEEEFGQGSTIKRGGSKRIRFMKDGHERFLADPLGVKCRTNQIKNYRQAYRNLKYDSAIRRPVSVKFIGPRNSVAPPFNIDEKIELLCQDSGIRGCWFRCTALQFSHKKLKVRYEDVQDEDGRGNLEEWVPAFRLAAPDKLGMRCLGRLNIRPCSSDNCLSEDVALDIGTAVDAWWSDGWWEGVIIGVDSCRDNASVHVYFPGEDIFIVCQRKNLRVSKEWVGDQWVDIKAKPDILSTISLACSQTKQSLCPVTAKGAESGSSAMSERGGVEPQANLNEEDMQMEVSLNRSGGRTDDRLLEKKQLAYSTKVGSDILLVSPSASPCVLQLTSCSAMAKGAESGSSVPDNATTMSDHANTNAREKQIETGCEMNDSDLLETAEQLNLRKRHRDEGSEENYDAIVEDEDS